MAAPCTKCINAQFVSYCSICMTGAPAQEEKEMGLNPYDPNVTVAMMEEERAMKQAEDALVADLRERWDRAFYAALTGLMSFAHEVDCGVDGLVHDAGLAADSTIRRHADMMASRDKLIAEVVG